MKTRIPAALAGLLLAGALPFAHAQVAQPAAAEEAIASVSRADDTANAIAQALNADASLKGTKITVQPDENSILLTGSTTTELQRVKATQIASASAGGKAVINTIASDENVIAVADPKPVASEADAAESTLQGAPERS